MDTITKNSVQVSHTVDKRFLMFTFPEHLKEAEAIEAIEEWDALFLKSEEAVAMVWNCIDMRNYDTNARMLWQEALSRHRKKIKVIYLISDSAIISTAARILAVFANLNIRPVKSLSKIPGLKSGTAHY